MWSCNKLICSLNLATDGGDWNGIGKGSFGHGQSNADRLSLEGGVI